MISEHETLHIFIGYDQVEAVSWHALTNSIMSRASMPVAFHPVRQSLMPFFKREMDPKQSNEFSFTRFLVPYMMEFKGWALFMDTDMMLRGDIKELFDQRDFFGAVSVVKHDYIPKSDKKYLGATQYVYDKKNWSSLMLFNCSHHHCARLTPEYVNRASGMDLHQFKWTQEKCIKELPPEWNWLVDEYTHNPDAKNVHWTNYGPWLEEFAHVDYADEWFEEKRLMLNATQNTEVGFNPFEKNREAS